MSPGPRRRGRGRGRGRGGGAYQAPVVLDSGVSEESKPEITEAPNPVQTPSEQKQPVSSTNGAPQSGSVVAGVTSENLDSNLPAKSSLADDFTSDEPMPTDLSTESASNASQQIPMDGSEFMTEDSAAFQGFAFDPVFQPPRFGGRPPRFGQRGRWRGRWNFRRPPRGGMFFPRGGRGFFPRGPPMRGFPRMRPPFHPPPPNRFTPPPGPSPEGKYPLPFPIPILKKQDFADCKGATQFLELDNWMNSFMPRRQPLLCEEYRKKLHVDEITGRLVGETHPMHSVLLDRVLNAASVFHRCIRWFKTVGSLGFLYAELKERLLSESGFIWTEITADAESDRYRVSISINCTLSQPAQRPVESPTTKKSPESEADDSESKEDSGKCQDDSEDTSKTSPAAQEPPAPVSFGTAIQLVSVQGNDKESTWRQAVREAMLLLLRPFIDVLHVSGEWVLIGYDVDPSIEFHPSTLTENRQVHLTQPPSQNGGATCLRFWSMCRLNDLPINVIFGDNEEQPVCSVFCGDDLVLECVPPVHGIKSAVPLTKKAYKGATCGGSVSEPWIAMAMLSQLSTIAPTLVNHYIRAPNMISEQDLHMHSEAIAMLRQSQGTLANMQGWDFEEKERPATIIANCIVEPPGYDYASDIRRLADMWLYTMFSFKLYYELPVEERPEVPLEMLHPDIQQSLTKQTRESMQHQSRENREADMLALLDEIRSMNETPIKSEDISSVTDASSRDGALVIDLLSSSDSIDPDTGRPQGVIYEARSGTNHFLTSLYGMRFKVLHRCHAHFMSSFKYQLNNGRQLEALNALFSDYNIARQLIVSTPDEFKDSMFPVQCVIALSTRIPQSSTEPELIQSDDIEVKIVCVRAVDEDKAKTVAVKAAFGKIIKPFHEIKREAGTGDLFLSSYDADPSLCITAENIPPEFLIVAKDNKIDLLPGQELVMYSCAVLGIDLKIRFCDSFTEHLPTTPSALRPLKRKADDETSDGDSSSAPPAAKATAVGDDNVPEKSEPKGEEESSVKTTAPTDKAEETEPPNAPSSAPLEFNRAELLLDDKVVCSVLAPKGSGYDIRRTWLLEAAARALRNHCPVLVTGKTQIYNFRKRLHHVFGPELENRVFQILGGYRVVGSTCLFWPNYPQESIDLMQLVKDKISSGTSGEFSFQDRIRTLILPSNSG